MQHLPLNQFVFGLGASLSFSLAFTQFLLADRSRLEPNRRTALLALSYITVLVGVLCSLFFFAD